ncbi:hypothetical protein CR513_07675, partial [Mucuna pruriens]
MASLTGKSFTNKNDSGGPPRICRSRTIRSDNGKEYANEIFDKFCEETGIKHQLIVPYTPHLYQCYQIAAMAESGGRFLTGRHQIAVAGRPPRHLPFVYSGFWARRRDPPSAIKNTYLDTIEMLLALTAHRGWKEEILVEQPEGFHVKEQEEKLYKLKNALYGADLIIVSTYIDDLLVTGTNEKLIMEFKAEMLQDCKSTTTPMNQKKKFNKDDGADKIDEHHCRSLIVLPNTMVSNTLTFRIFSFMDEYSDWGGSVDDMKSTTEYLNTFSK